MVTLTNYPPKAIHLIRGPPRMDTGRSAQSWEMVGGKMKYRDMVIEASDLREERRDDTHWWRRFKLRVLSSPAGEMAPEETVPCEYDDTYLKEDQLRRLDDRKLDQGGLIQLGQLLGSLLLPDGPNDNISSVRELFLGSLDLMGQDTGLRLRLRLPPELAVLPWEYVYATRAETPSGMAGFISLNHQVSIVRHEVLRAPVPSTRITGDITLVVALASPKAPDLDDINLDREEHYLREDLEHRPGIRATFLPKAKLYDVLAAVSRHAGVFHFAGHGAYQPKPGPLPRTTTGQGELVLEDQRVDAETLALNLHSNGVRLVVLNSCETGRRDGVNVWGSIASALVRCRVPAVVANQYKIRHECAIEFSRQFYRALVAGQPIERAVTAGRMAAYNADPNGRDWGVPVLYLRAEDGELFEGAADARVRDDARKAVEQLIMQQSVNFVQQHVEVDQRYATIGGIYVGRSAPQELKESSPASDTGSPPRPEVDGVSRDSSQKEGAPEAASTPPAEERTSPARIELVGEALRPVLIKLVTELGQDDLPLAFQSVFDLSYELARDREADVGVIARLVRSLVALAPGIVPKLHDVLSRDDLKNLIPSAALAESPHPPGLPDAPSPSS
jgi:hypothetical protein